MKTANLNAKNADIIASSVLDCLITVLNVLDKTDKTFHFVSKFRL